MKLYTAFLILCTLSFAACKRDGRCDCVPPPAVETSWKMNRIYGGFAGAEVAMTDEQRKAILTLKPNGTYVCRNSVTGVSSTGTVSVTVNQNNVQWVFTPLLPIYPATSFVVIQNTEGKLILSDGNADGYSIDFLLQH